MKCTSTIIMGRRNQACGSTIGITSTTSRLENMFMKFRVDLKLSGVLDEDRKFITRSF